MTSKAENDILLVHLDSWTYFFEQKHFDGSDIIAKMATSSASED